MYKLKKCSLQRFFVEHIDGAIPKNLVHQCLHVERIKVGEKIVLLNNSGSEFEVEISKVTKNEILYNVVKETPVLNEPSVDVHLYLSLLKSQEKFEFALQKAVELGVNHIHPILFEYTQVRFLRSIERLHRIIVEASEQSERGKLAVLHPLNTFESIFKIVKADSQYFVANETLRITAKPIGIKANEVHVIVGPEGGFSSKELESLTVIQANNQNVKSISLGKRILRAETATTCILSMILPNF